MKKLQAWEAQRSGSYVAIELAEAEAVYIVHISSSGREYTAEFDDLDEARGVAHWFRGLGPVRAGKVIEAALGA